MKSGAKLWGRLTIERTKKGLTQDDVAHVVKANRGDVSHWETGRCLPTPQRLRRLSKLFGVSTDYLLGVEP